MRLEDLDFDLPEELIAQEPLADRAASRLLWLHRTTGQVEHRTFRDCVEILQPGDLLVRNNTRVTALRLFGRRPSGAKVEALLLTEGPEPGSFEALVKPARKLGLGERIDFEGGLVAEVTAEGAEGKRTLRFDLTGEPLLRALHAVGSTPLPPYIHRRLEDPARYQTVYADRGGSAAAPTAGLHFTAEVLAALEAKGVRLANVTLDVGLDTFRPISSENPLEHRMHGERCEVPEETAVAVSECKGRVVAVGTTSVRTLESFAEGPRKVHTGAKVSVLYVTPNYRFRVVDGMFTNFHMPRTTMLLMISAMAGTDAVKQAYRDAVEGKYRFLSFGDSMLIL